MSDTGDCPLGLHHKECELRHEAIETLTASVRQLRNQMSAVKDQMDTVVRLGALIEAQDSHYREIRSELGKIAQVQEHIMEQIGNGRGGK